MTEWRPEGRAGSHPPKPVLTLNVGITGHRATLLSAEIIAALAPVVEEIFQDLRAGLRALYREEGGIFADAPPVMRLHTPIATGADQLALRCAQPEGFEIRALLPFAPKEYEKDFTEEGELEDFRIHLARADRVFALPGTRDEGAEAYVRVGKGVIAAADILIAIWDGKAGRGPGGTESVVSSALDGGLPVIHVCVEPETDTVVNVFLRTLSAIGDHGRTACPPAPERFKALVRDTLAPHEAIERADLTAFFNETERRFNPRVEYLLLLSLLGIKTFGKAAWRQGGIDEDIAREFGGNDHRVPDLELAYGWSNFLAIRYAQKFRSGHVTNYALSALAVLLALGGLLVPGAKVYLVMVELGVIGLLFYNTRAGRREDWHRKWLQYRHLAESLRTMPYLKRTGLAGPPFRSDFVRGPLHREAGTDWTRWYAAAVWRQLRGPVGNVTPAGIKKLAQEAVDQQVVPQAEYHEVNAHRMEHLDHGLHLVGTALLWSVITAGLLFVVGYYTLHDLVAENVGLFVFVTAGFPALGAAVFGMRGHGEHLLTASRSARTSRALEAEAARLRAVSDLETLAIELERTTETMLADLNEWTLAYRERSLEIPA